MLSKRHGATGYHGVSCSHHLRPSDPPLNPMECAFFDPVTATSAANVSVWLNTAWSIVRDTPQPLLHWQCAPLARPWTMPGRGRRASASWGAAFGPRGPGVPGGSYIGHVGRIARLALVECLREPRARLFARGGSTWKTAASSLEEHSWACSPAPRRSHLSSCERRRRRPGNPRTRRARSRRPRGTSVRPRPR